MLPLSIGKNEFILDSGAFSVWTRGVSIDIDKYIDFAIYHEHLFDYIVCLDHIPGIPGIVPSKEQVEDAARQSYKNANYMLKKGIHKKRLIPVFHQGEDLKWLEKYVSSFPFVGISPANDKTVKQRKRWLDSLLEIVTCKDGTPKIKMHGFGVTSYDLLISFPWYSADSRTWLNGSINRYIYVPRVQDKRYVCSKRIECAFADGSIRGANRNFNLFSNVKRMHTYNWIYDLGKELDDVTDDYKMRNYINFLFFLLLQEEIKQKKEIFLFFSGGENTHSSFYVEDMNTILNFAPSFLLSYVLLQNKKESKIKDIIMSLSVNVAKQNKTKSDLSAFKTASPQRKSPLLFNLYNKGV